MFADKGGVQITRVANAAFATGVDVTNSLGSGRGEGGEVGK